MKNRVVIYLLHLPLSSSKLRSNFDQTSIETGYNEELDVLRRVTVEYGGLKLKRQDNMTFIHKVGRVGSAHC